MANFHFRTVPSKSLPLVNSFCGIMDLKLGVSIITLFALLNKVAAGYGMIVIFTGSTISQLSFYIYSVSTILVLLWGLERIGEEDGPKTLLFAHLFAIDHFINTIYVSFFAVLWYVYTPHDGRRVANSDAQREVMESGTQAIGHLMDQESARIAAEGIWKAERGVSAVLLIGGWLIKFYFILCLYSFALHLYRQTYHSLPLSKPVIRSSYRYNTQPSSPSLPHRYTSTETTLSEALWEEEFILSANGNGNGKAGEEIELELTQTKGIGSAMSRSGSSNGQKRAGS